MPHTTVYVHVHTHVATAMCKVLSDYFINLHVALKIEMWNCLTCHIGCTYAEYWIVTFNMSYLQKSTPAKNSENELAHVSEGYAPSRATCTCDTCSHMCVSWLIDLIAYANRHTCTCMYVCAHIYVSCLNLYGKGQKDDIIKIHMYM